MNPDTADRIRERHWTCAQRLRERRRELKLTQMDVAERLSAYGTEMTNRTLSCMENGRGLDLGWLPELAAVLDCTVSYLLGLTNDPGTWTPDSDESGRDESGRDEFGRDDPGRDEPAHTAPEHARPG